MSNRNNDMSKNGISITRIETSDTISQFMEKCNNNFSNLLKFGGGTKGDAGEKGDQGVPTKPKVPIHVWKKGEQYREEATTPTGESVIVNYYENLQDVKYQEGHLIILESAHVYILKNVNGDLKPSFLIALQSYKHGDIIDGRSAYLHIAYADNVNGDNLVTNQELNSGSNETEAISTFNLTRNVSYANLNNVNEKPYMGIYSDFEEISSTDPKRYTWIRVQGRDGTNGANGTNGKDGNDFPGQLFFIDLEGDMSTISLNINRNRLYEGDYCECIAHAYYGNENIKLYTNEVSIKLPKEYYISNDLGDEIRISSINGSEIGAIFKEQTDNDVVIKFTPLNTFSFPENDIIFSIHVEKSVEDNNTSTKYRFTRDNMWIIKGIVSTFELEIIPQHRTIKLFNGARYPEELSVSVYKTENGEREIFDFSNNSNFILLYKNYDDGNWTEYTGAVDTKDVSCLEFKVVKNYDPENSANEEIWDYEDVWVIKDGVDGDNWQYIFCRSNKFPFGETGISDPSTWDTESDNLHTDPNEEYIPEEYKDIWFDDHQGVDENHKYEYQSYRKWDKINKCWEPYGSPTLYSNYSEDGKDGKDGSGYNVMLSNPVAVIPVGNDDWSVNEGGNNQSDSTFVYLYNNTTDMSSYNNVKVTLPTDEVIKKHFNATRNDGEPYKVTFTPIANDGTAFDFQSNTQYKLPITLEYDLGDIDGDGKSDIFTTTVNWTLTPIKGLEDIEVFVDKRVVNTSISDKHSFRVGYYLISTSGGKTFIESSADGDNKYNIVLTSEGNNLKPGDEISNYTQVDNWGEVYYDFVDDSGKNKNCYVVLVDSSYIIIDYTTVTSIKDGAVGASAMHLELTQDYIAVPASANGNGLHQNFIDDDSLKIQSQMILYNGDTEITKNIIYSFLIDGEDASSYIIENNNGIFTVNKSMITGDTNIECVAIYTPTGASFYKTLFIDVESTPYELEIDKNTLSRKVVSVDENGNIEDGYIVDTSINVKVKYWKNGSWCYVTDGDVLVKYSGGEAPFDKDIDNKTYTLTITDDNIKKNTIDLEVKIVYMENDDILSYENIGIINNGVDGVTKFKSTVFTRSVDKPTKPSGGSFGDPNPSNREIWKDGIPEGSKPIWSSYRWFSNEENFVSDWSDPVLMCDTPDFEVMYSSLDDISEYNPNEAIENTPFYKDTNGGIEGWLNETGLINKWLDDGGINSIWMATINKTNGKWGKWSISKIKGEKGETGSAPSCVGVKILGYSLSQINIDSDKWVDSLDDLYTDSEQISAGQKIYILNEYTWSDGTVTKGITVTLAGTQGVEGKSRVLFYLGSFEKDKATLKDDVVYGHLTPERCDYYIDYKGQAWMRIGQEDKDNGGLGVAGSKNGNGDNSDVWQKSEIVGFLQAGAIHADMINTGSITVGSGIVDKLFSSDIIAAKLTVTNANIDGELSGHTIQSNKKISETNSDPTWRIDNTGAGWLANKNIIWDVDGNITIHGEGTFIGQGTSIGDAWIITDDGIKSIDGHVKFNTDGSGHIGGFYQSSTQNSNPNELVQKGISWNKDGDVTFYDKIISKPEFINLSNLISNESSIRIDTTDKATYIFIDDDYTKNNDEIINNINDNECTCYNAYISWFNFGKLIKLNENTICNFTILNHSSKTVNFYIREENLRLPFSLKRDAVVPYHNYRLLNNNKVNYNPENKDEQLGSECGIMSLCLLPGTKLELCFEAYYSTDNNESFENFYINNISDFRLCYDEKTWGDSDDIGTPVLSPTLTSISYDLNNFNNFGGYSHPFTSKNGMEYYHMSLMRLIFGNYIYAPDVTGEIIFETKCYFKHKPNNEGINQKYNIFSSTNSRYSGFDGEYRSKVNLNMDYNYCIEKIFTPSTFLGFDIGKLNITLNESGYTKAQLVAYSPIYDTIYKSNEVDLTESNIKPFKFDETVVETLGYLGRNQQNSMLDLFVILEFFN